MEKLAGAILQLDGARSVTIRSVSWTQKCTSVFFCREYGGYEGQPSQAETNQIGWKRPSPKTNRQPTPAWDIFADVPYKKKPARHNATTWHPWWKERIKSSKWMPQKSLTLLQNILHSCIYTNTCIYIYIYLGISKNTSPFLSITLNSKPIIFTKQGQIWASLLWLYPCRPLGVQGERLSTSTSKMATWMSRDGS